MGSRRLWLDGMVSPADPDARLERLGPGDQWLQTAQAPEAAAAERVGWPVAGRADGLVGWQDRPPLVKTGLRRRGQQFDAHAVAPELRQIIETEITLAPVSRTGGTVRR